MRLLKSKLLALLLFPFLATAQDKLAATAAPYQAWPHSGSLTILTTPEGADLPASAAVEGFPLLVRLSGDRFDFKQARAGGEDLRYSTKDGAALAFEIEEWTPSKTSRPRPRSRNCGASSRRREQSSPRLQSAGATRLAALALDPVAKATILNGGREQGGDCA